MIFYNGLYFALRSGNDHRQLRFSPCQIELIENEGNTSYLQYTEDTSKNRPGNVAPKIVTHYANKENPERCFVRLNKKYISHCPINCKSQAFYLQPLQTPRESCWYSDMPLGHNKLNKAVASICKEAGIVGFKTNHSLRATTATRLYQAGIDEQIVMDHTGHKSVDGIRSYKRTSETQRKNVSNILNSNTPKKMCTSTLQYSNLSAINTSRGGGGGLRYNFGFYPSQIMEGIKKHRKTCILNLYTNLKWRLS